MRIIAIDPSTSGFGFAVFEAPQRLIDWGLVHVRAQKNAECLRRLEELMGLYLPTAVVVEDCADRGCQKRDRIRALISEIADYAAFFDLQVIRVPWRVVREVVGGGPRASKATIAADVAKCFPEVVDRLPPRRRPWMSEDARTSIFDAAAFGSTAIGSVPPFPDFPCEARRADELHKRAEKGLASVRRDAGHEVSLPRPTRAFGT